MKIEAVLITELGELVQQAHASRKASLIQSVLPASARALLQQALHKQSNLFIQENCHTVFVHLA
jgi:uncharacterized membrane protein YcaP (DUF421 family)